MERSVGGGDPPQRSLGDQRTTRSAGSRSGQAERTTEGVSPMLSPIHPTPPTPPAVFGSCINAEPSRWRE